MQTRWGNTLMTALLGSELTVNSQLTGDINSEYCATIAWVFKITGGEDAKVFEDGNLLYSGDPSGYESPAGAGLHLSAGRQP